jgi:hypothetical protein
LGLTHGSDLARKNVKKWLFSTSNPADASKQQEEPPFLAYLVEHDKIQLVL